MTRVAKTTKIFCFGNPYLENDNAALELADILSDDPDVKDFEFIKCETPDPLLEYEADAIIIVDVVQGIKKVCIIDDVSKLEAHSLSSMHDFDLGFFLKLIHAAGQVKNVRIIGIPQGSRADDVNMKTEVKKALLSMLEK